MGDGVRCFLLTPTGRAQRELWRDSVVSNTPVCGEHHWHTAFLRFDAVDANGLAAEAYPSGSPNWPAACSRCGKPFENTARKSVICRDVYRRSDTGEETTLRDAAVGAMWFAPWNTHAIGPDGRCLVVRCPDGHDWIVDGEANNCTRKGDRSHHCWIRHGEPPDVTVDKDGDTCLAGAGSILTPKWHGFLRNGVLIPC